MMSDTRCHAPLTPRLRARDPQMHHKSLIYNAFMAFYRVVTAVDLSHPCTSVTHRHRKSLKYIHFYMVTPPFVGGAGGVWVLADADQIFFQKISTNPTCPA